MKLQSALEYLMTYGWVIAIVAMVLAALWFLGFFNPATYVPKASPGQCYVARPDGPNSTQFMSLRGACGNEVPQYVTVFSKQGEYVVASPPGGESTSAITVTAWAYELSALGAGPCETVVSIQGQNPFYVSWIMNAVGGQGTGWLGCGANVGAASAVEGAICEGGHVMPIGHWVFLALTYDQQTEILYQNATQDCSVAESKPIRLYPNGNVLIGNGGPGGYVYPFNGYISNVQIYNTSLSANTIAAMYSEGVGGEPIDLQNLIGWWPLNGNSNDYSGNMDNANSYGINFNGGWIQTYINT